jgi:Pyridoxamine 5'-phosphate oxidase
MRPPAPLSCVVDGLAEYLPAPRVPTSQRQPVQGSARRPSSTLWHMLKAPRRMTAEEIDALVSAAVPARLATIDRDGFPHATPLWFIWADGGSTRRASPTARVCEGSQRIPSGDLRRHGGARARRRPAPRPPGARDRDRRALAEQGRSRMADRARPPHRMDPAATGASVSSPTGLLRLDCCYANSSNRSGSPRRVEGDRLETRRM